MATTDAAAFDPKAFFDAHMRYVEAGELDAMVRNTYAEDAVLYHNFPFFDGQPPYVVRGHDAIIATEKTIFAPENQGKIEAGEPFNFVGRDDFIGFQIFVTSPNTGRWLITDCWVIRDGKIAVYYAMGYRFDS